MNVMRRLKSIASGRSSVSDPGEDSSIKRVMSEQEVDHRVDIEIQLEEQCTNEPKDDVTSTSEGSAASTLTVNTRQEKSGYKDHEDVEPTVVSGNGTETGQIIVTTLSGRNGQQKQTLSYMAERVVGTGSFGVVFQAKCLETGASVAIKKVLQD